MSEGLSLDELLEHFDSSEIVDALNELGLDRSGSRAGWIDRLVDLDELLERHTGVDGSSVLTAFGNEELERVCALLDVPTGDNKGETVAHLEELVAWPGVSPSAGLCNHCGAKAPTRRVVFYQNIGFFVIWSNIQMGLLIGGRPLDALAGRYDIRLILSDSITGDLCKSCIKSFFWKFTVTTFLLGWWGYLAFLVAPIKLVSNLVSYLRCLRMQPVP